MPATRSHRHPPTPRAIVFLILALVLPMIGASPVLAGANAGGAMIVHTDDATDYTAEHSYCGEPLPGACEQLGTRTDKHAPNAAVIFAIAAFWPTAHPCVTAIQFGIHHNLPPNQGHFLAYSMCGTLELPDEGWPQQGAPGVGDLVATDPTSAHLWAFYWFAATDNGPGSFFCTRTYPTTNEAKFVDCGQPPVEDLCTNFGCVHWFDDGGGNNCPVAPPPQGACCFPDGHCSVLTSPECSQQGGTYQGDDASCTPNPCPQPTGACCFADGHCTVLTRADCANQDGYYRGDNTSCTPNPCPQPPVGACCFPDGHCTLQTQVQCAQQGGAWQGNYTSCTPNPCPPISGACCFADGRCAVLPQEECAQEGGSYQGDLTGCTPNPCPQPPTGACCLVDGRCAEISHAQCTQQGGTYQGNGTSCSPNPCPPGGACCFADGRCALLIQTACASQGGTWQGPGTSCTPNPCQQPPTGACCFADGSCQMMIQEVCAQEGGTWLGAGTNCNPNPCTQPPTGACCFPDGHCSFTTQALCAQQGGTFQGPGTSCDPNPCSPCGPGQRRNSRTSSMPILSARGTGRPNPLPGGRSVIFSEPPDLTGLITSSEIISSLGLESEIANDFSSNSSVTVHCATAWGGYYNNVCGCADNEVSVFRAKFYNDGGCVPNALLNQFQGTAVINSIGCESGVYPVYRYDLAVSQAIAGGAVYWMGFQATDHAFPPQWGRLAAPSTVGCSSMFLSVIFGFPNWTDCESVFGVPYDASQELNDATCGGPVPTQKTTWGKIKNLYR